MISCSILNILDDRLPLTLIPDVVVQCLGSPTLLCILGSHMFFNLKEAAEHGVNIGTNWSSYSHSAIRFEEPEPQSCEGLDLDLGQDRSVVRLSLSLSPLCAKLMADIHFHVVRTGSK